GQIPLRLFAILFDRLGNDARRSHAIVLLHAYQANTLRGATRLPDFAGIDADHFAIARDDHQIRFIGHGEDGDYLPGFLRGLHVDHALAAAIGEPVIGQLRALAV